MCAGEFGPNMQETSKYDPRYKFSNNHKKKHKSKGPLGSHTREGDAAHAHDTSSIQDDTFSTNRVCSRGSLGPPELANRFKKGPNPREWHGSSPSSVQVKFETVWPAFPIGRPLVGSSRRQLTCVGSPFDGKGGSRRHGPDPRDEEAMAPPYTYERRG